MTPKGCPADREILRGAAHGPRAHRRDWSGRHAAPGTFPQEAGKGRSPSGTFLPFPTGLTETR